MQDTQYSDPDQIEIDAELAEPDTPAEPVHREHQIEFELRGVSKKLWCGQNLPVVAAVSCSCGCDLTGGRLTLCDADGSIQGESSLSKDTKGWVKTGPITLRLPAQAGEHDFVALFEPDESFACGSASDEMPASDAPTTGDADPETPEAEAPAHEPVEHTFKLKVHPHKLTAIAWGIIGSHMVAAEQVDIVAGARCEAGCELKGAQLSIIDADTGDVVAQGPLDYYGGPLGDHWCRDFKLTAPQAGRHTWNIVFQGDGVHERFERPLTFTVLAHEPDSELTVRVFDQKGNPVDGALVTVSAPGESSYRVKTDRTGVAVAKVPEGIYKITASKSYLIGQTVRDFGILCGALNELEFSLEEDWNV